MSVDPAKSRHASEQQHQDEYQSNVVAPPQIGRVYVLAAGTATPPRKYTQDELIDLFNISDSKIQGLFRNSHIQSRYLSLPDPGLDGHIPEETNADLLKKHRTMSIELGSIAINNALHRAGCVPADVDYLVCVTSTGFLCPGLSAWLIRENGFRENVHRIDVVAMGCNAGLNGLHPVVDFCALHPGSVGLIVCAEICSAAYVVNERISTAVVNSLFGDGVAALVVGSERPGSTGRNGSMRGPIILGFESHIMPSHIDAMRYDLDGTKLSFYLDRDIPYVIGAHVSEPISRLLPRFGLQQQDVRHWLIHSGGRKVIRAIQDQLRLTDHDVRHTLSVLRDYGNVSSGSFLFSYERLEQEGVTQPGDYVVMMTMGPGSTIECCLGQF